MLSCSYMVVKIDLLFVCGVGKKCKYPTDITVVSDSMAICRHTSSTESVQD